MSQNQEEKEQKTKMRKAKRLARTNSVQMIAEIEELTENVERRESSDRLPADSSVEKTMEKRAIRVAMTLIGQLDEPYAGTSFANSEEFVEELVVVSRNLLTTCTDVMFDCERVLRLVEELVLVIQKGLKTLPSTREVVKLAKKVVTSGTELKGLQEGGVAFDGLKSAMRLLLREVKHAITFNTQSSDTEFRTAVTLLLNLTEDAERLSKESKPLGIVQCIDKSKR